MSKNDDVNIDINKLKNNLDKSFNSNFDYTMEKYDIGKFIDLPGIAVPTNDSIIEIQKILAESERNEEERHMKKEQYDKDVLETLKKIEGNTANLTTLVDLIQSSNETQGEILEIINELLSLAKEKDIELANSKYRTIMNRITTFTKDANTITTLSNFGITIYHILNSST